MATGIAPLISSTFTQRPRPFANLRVLALVPVNLLLKGRNPSCYEAERNG
jgi:hypothetical protein